MIFIKKLLLISVSVAIPASGVIVFAAKKLKNQDPNTTFLESIKDWVSPSKSNDKNVDKGVSKGLVEYFLKVGNTDTKAETVVKEILKTYSGSNLLFEKIVETLVDKWAEDVEKKWETSESYKEFLAQKTKIQQDIKDSEKLQTTIQLNQEKKEDYAKISLLANYKNLLIKFLEKNINIYLDGSLVDGDDYDTTSFNASKSNFVSTKSTDNNTNEKVISLEGKNLRDKFTEELSSIWKYVFEHWVLTERPIYVQQFTWSYASSFKDKEHQFEESSKNLINLPSKPNYYFPSIDENTNNKFKAFVNSIDSLTSEKDLTTVNESSRVDRVMNVSDSKLNSREAIALSYLEQNNIFTSTVQAPKKIISKSELTNKSLLAIFGIKPEENFPANKNDVMDFVLVKDTEGIFYRDVHGVHYITKKNTNTKDLLINTLEKHKVTDNQKFDLFVALKEHLNKNFYTIMMNYLHQKNVTKTSSMPQSNPPVSSCTASVQPCLITDNTCLESNEKCLYQIGQTLSKVFTQKQLNKKIADLNGLLLKNYFEPLNTNLIITSEKNKLPDAKNLLRGYYVKFPEDVKWNNNTSQNPPLISLTENIFKSTIPKPNYETEWTTYKANIDKLLENKKSTNRTNAFSFISVPPTPAIVTDKHLIDIDHLIEAVFLKLLSENLITKWLINKEKTNHIKNYDFEKYEYKDSVNENEFLYQYNDKNYFKKTDTQINVSEFVKKLNTAVVKENQMHELFNNRSFFEFKDWHSGIKDETTLITFLKNSEKELKTGFSIDDSGILSAKYSDLANQWNTIFWLLDNNFENYKTYLQTTINKHGFGAFVFSTKFDPKLCVNIPGDKGQQHKQPWSYEKTFSNIDKRFKSEKEESTESHGCADLYDQFSTVKIKVSGSDKEFSGFKGFIHADNYPNVVNLPENLWSEISAKTKDKKSTPYYIHGNTHSSYVMAIHKDDVAQLDGFDTWFTKNNITPELILADIVKLSKNTVVQNMAISDFLSKNKLWINSQSYNKLDAGDWRLKQSIPFEWQKP